jgi:hypothetical protein
VRLTLTETPDFLAAAEAKALPRVPILDLLRDHGRATIAGTAGVIACFAIFYLATAFALNYGTATLHYGREAFLGVQLGAILFMAAGIAVAGIAADRRSARRVLGFAFVATLVVGLAMPLLFTPESLPGVFVWLAAALFTMGFAYGPLGGWLPSLFPAGVRYTGVSIAFNVGGVIGGGLTPMIAVELARHGGLFAVGLYLGGAAVLSLIGVALTPRGAR